MRFARPSIWSDRRIRQDLPAICLLKSNPRHDEMGHIRRLRAVHAQTQSPPPTLVSSRPTAAVSAPKYALPPIALTPDRDLKSASS